MANTRQAAGADRPAGCSGRSASGCEPKVPNSAWLSSSRMLESPEIVAEACCTSNRSVDACRMLSISFSDAAYRVSTALTASSAAVLVTRLTPISSLPFFRPASTCPNTTESRESASAAVTARSPPARISVTRRDMRSASTIWRLARLICEAGAPASDMARTTSSSRAEICGMRPVKLAAVSLRLTIWSWLLMIRSASWAILVQMVVTFFKALLTPAWLTLPCSRALIVFDLAALAQRIDQRVDLGLGRLELRRRSRRCRLRPLLASISPAAAKAPATRRSSLGRCFPVPTAGWRQRSWRRRRARRWPGSRSRREGRSWTSCR